MCCPALRVAMLCVALTGPIAGFAQSATVAPPGAEARAAEFVVELRLNGRSGGQEFHEVVIGERGQTLIPVAAIIGLGEGLVEQDGQVHRYSFPSAHQSLSVDLGSRQFRANDRSGELAAGDYRVSDGVLLLDKQLIEEVFEASIELDAGEQRLVISTHKPWPLDLRLARERQWERLGMSADAQEFYLDVQQDYEAWGKPQADVSLGLSDRGLAHSALLVGEVAGLTGHLFATGSNGRLSDSRLRLGRTHAEGGVFGIRALRDLQMGDVQALRLPLVGSGASGRGLSFQARPLGQRTTFDALPIEGDALPGWSAELFSGLNLVDFMRVGNDGRYRFDNIPLGYGSNTLRVVLHGPQGQQREVLFSHNVGGEMVPAGETYSQGYVLRPNRMNHASVDGNDSVFVVDHGINRHLTVGAFISSLTGTPESAGAYSGLRLRTSAGAFSAGMDYADQRSGSASTSARALQGRLSGQVGSLLLDGSLEQFGAGFRSPRNQSGQIRSITTLRAALPLPFGVVRDRGPGTPAAPGFTAYVNAGVEAMELQDGSRQASPSLQVSHALDGWSLGHSIYGIARTRASAALQDAEPSSGMQLSEANYRLIGMRSVGRIQIRGSIERQMRPTPQWRRLALSAAWPSGRDTWSADAASSLNGSVDTGVHWTRDLRWALLSFSSFYSRQAGVSLGLSLNFTLSGSARGGSSSQYKATQGQATVRVFTQAPDEPGSRRPLEGAAVFIDNSGAPGLTDAQGQSEFAGLPTHRPSVVKIDPSSLPDNFLVPVKPPQRFWARPGQSILLEVPMTESAEITGRLLLDGTQPLTGIRLEIYNGEHLHAQTTSLNDGFFSFSSVYPGQWRLQLAPDQTWRTRPLRSGPLTVDVDKNALRKDDVQWTVYSSGP